jgi:hypothetical protein
MDGETEKTAVAAKPAADPTMPNYRIAIAWCKVCDRHVDVELMIDGCLTTTDERQQQQPFDSLKAPRWLPSALLLCAKGHTIMRVGVTNEDS